MEAKEVFTIDLNGMRPGATVLAQIATALETHGSVYVKNAFVDPDALPGAAAMHFGARLQRAFELLAAKESTT